MRLVLETDGDGSWSQFPSQCLRLGPPGNLVEVEGRYVEAVTWLKLVLVEVFDVFGRGELLKIGVEEVDGRLVNVEVDDHLMALVHMVVRCCGARHHLLAINVGDEGNV